MIIAWSVVSVNPPLLLMIVAHPLEDASKAVLPNGSSHLEGTTAISDLLSILSVFLWLINPISLCLGCDIYIDLLSSSPIE